MRTTYVALIQMGDDQWAVFYHGRRGESREAITRAIQSIAPMVRIVSLTDTHREKEWRAAMAAYGKTTGDPLPLVHGKAWIEQQRQVTERISNQLKATMARDEDNGSGMQRAGWPRWMWSWLWSRHNQDDVAGI